MALAFACSPLLTVEDLDNVCPCKSGDATAAEITAIIEAASDIIAILTEGAVAGECEVTVRPCRERYDCVCGTCGTCQIDGIALPGTNVRVTEVKINGDVVPASDYVLVDGYKLVRRSGTWPALQKLTDPDTEDRTFSVSFTHGQTPLLGTLAAIEVACDLIGRWIFGKTGKLPQNWSMASADGVTVNRRTPFTPSDLDEDAFPELRQLLLTYGGGSNHGAVYSPELMNGWTLHTVEFAAA